MDFCMHRSHVQSIALAWPFIDKGVLRFDMNCHLLRYACDVLLIIDSIRSLFLRLTYFTHDYICNCMTCIQIGFDSLSQVSESYAYHIHTRTDGVRQ